MILPGERIDVNIPLRVVQGGVEKNVVLKDLLSRRTVVSVYMRNNTPTCDRQNVALCGGAAEFERLGCNVVAVSRDTVASHRRYAAKHRISHVLASDPEDRFSKAADALVEKSMYGRVFVGPARAAYIIDPDGTVRAVVPKVDAADHLQQLMTALKAL